METSFLNLQADRIEMILAAHHAPACVRGGRLTQRSIEYHITPDPTTELRWLEALTDKLALALGVSSARLMCNSNTLSILVPRPDTRSVSLISLSRRLESDAETRRAIKVPGTAILGIDSDGIPLLLRLSCPDITHVLMAGLPGSGKTELARTIISSLLLHQRPRDLVLALFDTRGRGMRPFARAPHLLFPVAKNPEDIRKRMQHLVSEMERREREQITRPRLVVVIDGIDLARTNEQDLEAINLLVQKGQNAGISLLLCLDTPSAPFVSKELANMPVRIIGKTSSAEDARIIAGLGGTGGGRLRGRGDFVLVAGEEILHFQAAQVASEEILRLCGRSRQRTLCA